MLVLVVVANGRDGMASHNRLARLRHVELPRMRDLCAFKGVIHGEAEYEGIAGSKASLELVQHAADPVI